LFKSIRTHALVDEEIKTNEKRSFARSKQKILDAMRKGRVFFSNYYHGDAKGFRFYAEYKGRSFITGDTITMAKGGSVLLKALLPKEAIIKLVHNGTCISEKTAMEASWDAKKPGVYRVECWLNDKGWIFSNHIRIEK